MEKTGAIDVYFEEKIEVLMPGEEPPAASAVAEVLTATKINYTSIEKGAF